MHEYISPQVARRVRQELARKAIRARWDRLDAEARRKATEPARLARKRKAKQRRHAKHPLPSTKSTP